MFDPIRLRGLTFPNRVWMSPMCTYSADAADDRAGRPTDFHLAHYGSRAAGGASMVMVEATGVVPEGRIWPYDLGIWSDDHVADFARVVDAIEAGGSVPAIQLAHAGRKASVDRPWVGGLPVDVENFGWQAVGPSALAFPDHPVPTEMTVEDIGGVIDAFGQAARRARDAGFKVAEVHAAHGYLLHSFLSPLTNQRTDQYGGSLENRMRIVLDAIDAVRAQWDDNLPVLLRVSTTDWIDENPDDSRPSWTIEQTIELAARAREHGVDLVDASSGGNDVVPIPHDVDYQTRYARKLRSATGMPVAAVGRISRAHVAEALVEDGSADTVFIGRAMLRDPSWANNAADSLGASPRYIEQYEYAL
ncbi:NADH:flavin oxidoreductase/NADH oxidase [Rhodococcoides yunnanense]|uniref:NADH:flavin oxidoreductase/NADH oxidase n=1 Tax=Rhodococcoides yunnanense TaxID=278209 RepID=A0ABU4B6H1_9NOCA|nr:NADH:flavin oxidoreductase/NADH oxidase [Rhodococcus yunnanensis]MDV6259785.1 NADH:flavin oxidoreductase/NADH oxidase [Rhodococcus yunnanensis]